jgi:TonB-dependent Receptor Plug Domain
MFDYAYREMFDAFFPAMGPGPNWRLRARPRTGSLRIVYTRGRRSRIFTAGRLRCRPGEVRTGSSTKSPMYCPRPGRSTTLRSVAIAAVAAACIGTVRPQRGEAQVVEGTAIDAQTGAPIPDVALRLLGPGMDTTRLPVLSDDQGQFALHVDTVRVLGAGPLGYRIRAQRIGYRPLESAIDLESGRVVSVKLSMAATSQAVASVVVTGRKALSINELTSIEGFEYRRSKGYGTYLDAEQLKQKIVADFAMTLVSELPALRVAPDTALIYRFGRDPRTGQRVDCIPHVYVDGFLRRDSLAALEELQMYAANDLYGVELYTPGNFPVALAGTMEADGGVDPQHPNGAAYCAVIVVWRMPAPGTTRRNAVATGIQTLRGHVIDADTHLPVADARLELATIFNAGLGGAVRTDSGGAFTVRTKQWSSNSIKRFRLQANRIGYKAVTTATFAIGQDETITFMLEMSSTAQLVAPLTILARERPVNIALRSAQGFDMRRQQAIVGTFFGRDEIERRGALAVLDLLRGMAGVTITGSVGAESVQFRSGGAGAADGRACAPNFFLDGNLLMGNGPETLATLSISEVYGVEVYKSALDVPPEFSGVDTSCGAVVVWTRR